MKEKYLIDQTMRGLEGGQVRVYEEKTPTMAARIYKEPHLVVEVEDVCEKRICAMRGRDSDEPTKRSKSEHYEQRLELGPVGVANNLTRVSKDNLILEKKKVKVRQATKEGFIEVELPGIADLNYPTSLTRRGRVIGGGQNMSDTDNGEYP